MEVVNLTLNDITPYEKNPRKNKDAIDPVAESIKQFGFKVPIIVDKNKVIVAGHTRYQAAKKLGLTEVPCIIAEDLTPDQIKAFRIADNKVAEIATWDEKLLSEELDELKDLFAWDKLGLDLDEYLPYNDVKEDDFDVAGELENIVIPKAKRGDIYQLGRHRLMCGDSTNKEQVAELMNGQEADLVLTDPPYNVNYGTKNAYNPEKYTDRTILNDYMPEQKFIEFLSDAFINMHDHMKTGAGFYVFHASISVLEFETALRTAQLKTRQQLIWVKDSLVLGRQDYQWKHEPILYGWKEGSAHHFSDDRTNTTILWDKPIDTNSLTKDEMRQMLDDIYSTKLAKTIFYHDRPKSSDEHPTMKPILLLVEMIKNSSDYGQTVVDYFGGSGSTLIASEQTGRTCYTMELDEKFADVIIKRWETLTGQKAVLVKKGEHSND
jgi:site-specific DNA-methyltransferase (adenine-specific)